MDYFTKFLRPGGQAELKPEVDHVGEFHKSWMLVKNTLLFPDERQLTRGISSTDVPKHLTAMVDGLVHESSHIDQNTTGGCLEYLLKNDVLGVLIRLSEPDRPAGVLAEVLRAISNMVLLLDEQFLVHSAVHRAVIRLLRTCVGDEIREQVDGKAKPMGAAGMSVKTSPMDYELDLVDLLCILCSRIRSYPDLLMIFFHDKNWFQSQGENTIFEVNEEEEEEDDEDFKPAPPLRAVSPALSSASTITSPPPSVTYRKPEYEFLIFNYLLRFVHREGKIGDFARAALLFLMDVAMAAGGTGDGEIINDVPTDENSAADAALALAEYVLDGDFSEVLGAGLGAVYSLLPFKLHVRREPNAESSSTGMVLGGSAEEDNPTADDARAEALGLESSENPDFRAKLDHFLKLLEFVQDVLRRNTAASAYDNDLSLAPSALIGSAIADSVLNAFRTTFLKNVLYPSVLECSDMDGSAVAVMSYIDIILETLRERRMTNLLVEFLVSEEDGPEPTHSRERSGGKKLDKQNKLRRRKSSAMMLLEMEAKKPNQSAYFSSLGRFTLKDLIVSSLKSKSEATAGAALQLLTTLLTRHCGVTTQGLLSVVTEVRATSFPTPLFLYPNDPIFTPDEQPTTPEGDDIDAFLYPPESDSPKHQTPSHPLFVQPTKTLPALERELALYLSLVSQMDPKQETFSTGYDNYLQDAVFGIQHTSCFDYANDSVPHHRLLPTDTLLTSLLQSLRLFFSHSPEHNVALTGTLASISMCPHRSIAGWLTCADDTDTEVDWDVDDLEPSSTRASNDGDDRSVDFDTYESRRMGIPGKGFTERRRDPKSLPVLYIILSGLASQIDRYRRLVDDFDKYLADRRQGLVFSENMNDALNLVLEISPEGNPSLPSKAGASTSTPTKPKMRKKSSSFVTSFFTPQKAAPKTPRSSDLHTPSRAGRTVPVSPFTPHYQQTGAIDVQPFIAPPPIEGPWSPAPMRSFGRGDVFSSFAEEEMEPSTDIKIEHRAATRVTLSQLLDNVVVLEESIKELAAIAQVRSSLGIDTIRYL